MFLSSLVPTMATSDDAGSHGQWIAASDASPEDYHRVDLFRRVFDVRERAPDAQLRIVADTTYQVWINDRYVANGPVRSYPEHCRYDTLPIGALLRPGKNIIAIETDYWGRDTAKSIAVRPGLWFEVGDPNRDLICTSDGEVMTRRDVAMNRHAPVVSMHLGFEEQFVAGRRDPGWRRIDHPPAGWERCEVIGSIDDAPWKDLAAAGMRPMASTPIVASRVMDARVVRPPRIAECINIGRMHGVARKVQAANRFRCVLTATVRSGEDQAVRIRRPTAGVEFGSIRIGGATIDVRRDLVLRQTETVRLARGDHPLVIVLDGRSEMEEFQWIADADGPLSMVAADDDRVWKTAGPIAFDDPRWDRIRSVRSAAALRDIGVELRDAETPEVRRPDVHARTTWRRASRDGASPGELPIDRPSAMLIANGDATVVEPGDDPIEFLIDMGVQTNFRACLHLDAPAGVTIDANVLERLVETDRLSGPSPQWSWRNRSGFRYVTREGDQSYRTRNHFGGRYVFLTIGPRKSPVRIRHFGGEFWHFPVTDRGQFHCDDAVLNDIWEISRRTMLACMEDTFVDCPLYEQSLWLGDARNEALTCYRMFGESDIVRRCVELGAHSLERDDLAGMRVPTRFTSVKIPAWAFLWARMGVEHHRFTGDERFLREVTYPAATRMLDRVLSPDYTDASTGLFAVRAWNFFDWSGMDIRPRIVTHNNTFLVDTLNLYADVADDLGDVERSRRYRREATDRIGVINEHLWNPTAGAYADAIDDDGTLSLSLSKPANTLALLHGVVPADRRRSVSAFVDAPVQEDVVEFGSPFATLYLLEYLAAEGRIDEMLTTLRGRWSTMIDDQTTTFWESFATGDLGGERYPTRSYCHAWSAAAAYALSRHVLGVHFTSPGGGTFEVTPHLSGFETASGRVPLAGRHVGIGVRWTTPTAGGRDIIVDVPPGTTGTLHPPKGWRFEDRQFGSEHPLEPGRQMVRAVVER